jgi:hypothetical protein
VHLFFHKRKYFAKFAWPSAFRIALTVDLQLVPEFIEGRTAIPVASMEKILFNE